MKPWSLQRSGSFEERREASGFQGEEGAGDRGQCSELFRVARGVGIIWPLFVYYSVMVRVESRYVLP